MIRQSAVVLVLSTVVFAAVVSGVVVVNGQNQNAACTCTTFRGDSAQTSTANLAVVVDGSHSSVSTNQRTVQSDGRTRVHVVVRFDGESITVSGETAENGTLVFNVTRNGTPVNESVVLRSSENRTLVVRVNRDGAVRITRNDESVCDPSAVATGANLEIGGIDIGGGEGDADDSFGCTTANSSCTCSASSTELSPPVRRMPASAEGGVDTFRAVVRSSDLEGLERPGLPNDCAGVDSEATADCRAEAR